MSYLEKAVVWRNFKELDPRLRQELDSMSDDDLKEAFTHDLEFGTGGLRGILGVGTNRMNIYMIRKATLGFGQYLETLEHAHERGVVIAHDNRHFSTEFALETARVFATMGFRVYLFEGLRPTPELSFAVRELKAIGGVMITASHNPKQYNGYKIYDETGCQLVPELADIVINNISKIDNMFEIPSDLNHNKIQYIGKELDDKYLAMVESIRLRNSKSQDLKVVYTPLHGTGQVFTVDLLQKHGYQVFPVETQMTNDPNFSGVKSSNPEEQGAYIEALELAKKEHADIVLATDPDADRLGFVVLHNNEYVFVNGNQSAVLLSHYILTYLKESNQLPENGYVFSTNVSSTLPLMIAKSFGMNTYVSLTGFKFIGEQARKIEGSGTYVFGFEESYGCLIKDFVRDKDAIQAVFMVCEMAAYYKEKQMTLIDALQEIYKEYGYYSESITNITLAGLSGKQKIEEIMNYFRNNEIQLKNGSIIEKQDNWLQVTMNYEKNRVITSKILLPKSNVIKYILDDQSWFVLRPSGTEPKLKIYYNVIGKTAHDSEKKLQDLKEKVLKLVNQI